MLSESRPNPLPQLLAALAATLERPSGDPSLRAVFEQHVRDMLAIRSVRLREVPARYHARLVTPTRTNDAVVIGVPTADPREQAVLEAWIAAGQSLELRARESTQPDVGRRLGVVGAELAEGPTQEIRGKLQADDLLAAVGQALGQLDDPGYDVGEIGWRLAVAMDAFTGRDIPETRDRVQQPELLARQRAAQSAMADGTGIALEMAHCFTGQSTCYPASMPLLRRPVYAAFE